jgi:hypothetical protein
VSVNGTPVAEASWDGLVPRAIEAAFDSSVLREGPNTLEVLNVGDTAAATSFVHLDRFEVTHPRNLAARAGRFEGRFDSFGAATVYGLAGAHVLDTTEGQPVWLSGGGSSPAGLSFRAEAGRRYLAVSAEAVARPEVRLPEGLPRHGGREPGPGAPRRHPVSLDGRRSSPGGRQRGGFPA